MAALDTMLPAFLYRVRRKLEMNYYNSKNKEGGVRDNCLEYIIEA